MRYIARFYDNPHKLDIRRQAMAEHLAYLQTNNSEILVAGSLRDSPEADPVGALWIIEAVSRERAEQLIKSDPFFVQGLRSRYELLHWSKAFDKSVEL